MFNFASFKAFFAVAAVIATVGTFWLQDTELKNTKEQLKNRDIELKECKDNLKAKEFEQKWSTEFSSAFIDIDAKVENESNKTNSNTSFYDTF